jgi:hypothetical protein
VHTYVVILSLGFHASQLVYWSDNIRASDEEVAVTVEVITRN